MPEGVEARLMDEFLNTWNDYWIISYKIHSGRYKRHGEPKGFDILGKNYLYIYLKLCQKVNIIIIKIFNL